MKQGLETSADFDLPVPGTYYTRPMSPPWSKPLDVDRLSRGGAEVDFDIPLTALPRLASRAAMGGSARGSVRFERQSGTAVADLSFGGTARLQCQRCMQAMELPLRSAVRVALLASEEQAGALPEQIEPMLAPDGWISVADLVEEELLLALPIVALHEAGDCPARTAADERGPAGPDDQATQRPFARLGELLSHK